MIKYGKPGTKLKRRTALREVEGLIQAELSDMKYCFLYGFDMDYTVYILRMKDGRYYVGMTNDLERRSGEHGIKSGTRTTKISGYERILYTEQHPDRDAAHAREQQLKRWTRAKKEALINGDKSALRSLSRLRKD